MAKKENRAHALGRAGEDWAAKHLASRGWTIVERNWRCPFGELDIIATDPSGVTVFCEVKTRSGLNYGDPLEAITHAKLTKLRELATYWLKEHSGVSLGRVRFDAIGILFRPPDRPKIHHVEGIRP